LLDALQVKASNAYSKLSLKESPTLFLNSTAAKPASPSNRSVSARSRRNSAAAVRMGNQGRGPQPALAGAHDSYWAMIALRPAARASPPTSACRFQSSPNALRTQRDIAELKLTRPSSPCRRRQLPCRRDDRHDDKDEVARARQFHERLVERAIAMDGTCTGEHGVGQGKIKYLEAEHGKAAVEVMRSLKRALDPDDIFNPGKIVIV